MIKEIMSDKDRLETNTENEAKRIWKINRCKKNPTT